MNRLLKSNLENLGRQPLTLFVYTNIADRNEAAAKPINDRPMVEFILGDNPQILINDTLVFAYYLLARPKNPPQVKLTEHALK